MDDHQKYLSSIAPPSVSYLWTFLSLGGPKIGAEEPVLWLQYWSGNFHFRWYFLASKHTEDFIPETLEESQESKLFLPRRNPCDRRIDEGNVVSLMI